MTTREVIVNADSFVIDHIYGDGTALYDIGIGNKACTIRVPIDDFNLIREQQSKQEGSDE